MMGVENEDWWPKPCLCGGPSLMSNTTYTFIQGYFVTRAVKSYEYRYTDRLISPVRTRMSPLSSKLCRSRVVVLAIFQSAGKRTRHEDGESMWVSMCPVIRCV